MDGYQIQRVRTHAAALSPQAFDIARLFVNRLYSACPELAEVFPKRGQALDRELTHRMAFIIKHIDNLDEIGAFLSDMGAYYARIGFGRGHFEEAREALMDALRIVCFGQWTSQHEEDWSAAVDSIRAHIEAGARFTPVAQPSRIAA